MDRGEPQLIRQSSRKRKSAFICTKCKQGRMEPLIQEREPEYTDIFECNHCHNKATIPSLVIIYSQIFSAVLGGAVSVYLFIQHLAKVLRGFQFNTTENLSVDITLMSIAAFFIAGFGYVFYRAFIGITRRSKYKRN